MVGSDGARRVWSVTSKAIGYNSHRCGPLPQPYDAEALCQQVFAVLWAAMLTSAEFAGALGGERGALSQPEKVALIDATLALLLLEGPPTATAMSPEMAGESLDRAFLFASRETPLYGAMRGFLVTLIERVIRKARARVRVEDGTGADGKRRRRYLAKDIGLTAALCESLLGDEGRADAVTEGMDCREALAKLTPLERAICWAYFADKLTLKDMADLPWPGDQGRQVRLSVHQIRDIRDRGARALRRITGTGDK